MCIRDSDTTVNWYFSLENIQTANDRILQFVDRMDLPNLYPVSYTHLDVYKRQHVVQSRMPAVHF